MKHSRTLLLAVFALCAMTAFAVQYPTSPSAGQAQQPSTQMPQTQSPQSTTPSAPAPQTGDQQGQAGAQQQQPGRPSIDDQVKTLTTQLNLSSDQQTKMRSILETQHQQAMTIVNNNSLSKDEKITQVHALRENTIQQARGILNDDQRKKLDSMLQENDQHMHPQSQPGQQTPGTTTPGTTTPP
ncbi:MAG TPA: hypothetical protein VJN64_02450, partial [Terriglobales bacterium]|nr:hypothetical protein [Terriglobales bacterium]